MKAHEEVELELTTRATLAQRLKNMRPGLNVHQENTMLWLLLEDLYMRVEQLEAEVRKQQ